MNVIVPFSTLIQKVSSELNGKEIIFSFDVKNTPPNMTRYDNTKK